MGARAMPRHKFKGSWSESNWQMRGQSAPTSSIVGLVQGLGEIFDKCSPDSHVFGQIARSHRVLCFWSGFSTDVVRDSESSTWPLSRVQIILQRRARRWTGATWTSAKRPMSGPDAQWVAACGDGRFRIRLQKVLRRWQARLGPAASSLKLPKMG